MVRSRMPGLSQSGSLGVIMSVRLWLLLFLVFVSFGLAAEDAPEGASDAASLEARVVGRWDALIAKDFAAAYMFASPSYRQVFSPQQFAGRFVGGRVKWQRVEVTSIEPAGEDAARVDVRVYYRFFQPDTEQVFDMQTMAFESWVRSDGEWWFVPED